tara:strand:- start:237 stop:704 length:468 start_codon:yes stop_codon:yes gene_type:complete
MFPSNNLVPSSNRQSTGVSRGPTPQIARFIPINNMPTQQSSIGFTPLVPDLTKGSLLSSGADQFASLISQVSIQDTDLPCVGVNLDVGGIRNRYKQINNMPNLSGTYPQIITARGPGVGLAVDRKQLDDLNNKVLRPQNTFSMFMNPPFKPPGVY